MKIISHGTEFLGAFTEDQTIQVALEDRQGNVISLFFDGIEALEGVRDALTEMVIEADKARNEA